ncbi:chordin-like protein 1 [Trichonephila clavipes]|uniref:Chordin-like protein 1 n=1 Tax=Trichonephila clavipes TaxID=2585209 RepID=A0A8X6S6W4_TRICX|nr:chordin-like protein 1 [Trichonephila clavipes]
MDWPARSPDLNPIEHVWDFLGRRLAARTLPPVTIRELRLALQDEWAAMPQQLIDTLILSMGRRCETCLAVREIIYPTKDRMFLAGHPSQGYEILPSEQASPSNPVLVTIMISDSQSQRGDCIAAGVTYSHGSSWHPVIGPFGPMDCVYCKCQNGKIECSRLNCPPLQTLACSKPIQVPGHCCPICAEKAPEILEKDIEPSLSQPPISVTMEHKGTRQIPDSKKSSEPMVNCLPPLTNTVVFRSHASSSSSAYYQYAFQSVNGDQSTRLLTWTVKDGRIGDFSEQHLSKEEFKALMGTFQFKLQGATRTKFMEKFIRKAKRLPDRCGGRCATKIQHLGQVLHLREVIQRQQCLAQETSFHQ